jgi:6-phosphogluconolactonase
MDHEMKFGRSKVFVFDHQKEISDFVIRIWDRISRRAVRVKGLFFVGLSGGKTPVGLYQRFSGTKERLFWEKTHVFLVDERFVPFDHPDSNYRMLKEILFDHVPLPRENIHPIPTEGSTLEASATAYEKDLRKSFGLLENGFPGFDLLILGIGEDGHTASLFPGSPVLKDRMNLVASVPLNETKHSRITLTLPVINHAKHILFLVTGKDKAPVLRKIIDGKDSSLPASMVHSKRGSLIFVLDREASILLSGS